MSYIQHAPNCKALGNRDRFEEVQTVCSKAKDKASLVKICKYVKYAHIYEVRLLAILFSFYDDLFLEPRLTLK